MGNKRASVEEPGSGEGSRRKRSKPWAVGGWRRRRRDVPVQKKALGLDHDEVGQGEVGSVAGKLRDLGHLGAAGNGQEKIHEKLRASLLAASCGEPERLPGACVRRALRGQDLNALIVALLGGAAKSARIIIGGVDQGEQRNERLDAAAVGGGDQRGAKIIAGGAIAQEQREAGLEALLCGGGQRLRDGIGGAKAAVGEQQGDGDLLAIAGPLDKSRGLGVGVHKGENLGKTFRPAISSAKPKRGGKALGDVLGKTWPGQKRKMGAFGKKKRHALEPIAGRRGGEGVDERLFGGVGNHLGDDVAAALAGGPVECHAFRIARRVGGGLDWCGWRVRRHGGHRRCVVEAGRV